MEDLNRLLKPGVAERISRNKDEIAKAAQSADGRRFMESVDAESLKKSLDAGDMASVKNALDGAMKTEAGQRLFKELSRILSK